MKLHQLHESNHSTAELILLAIDDLHLKISKFVGAGTAADHDRAAKMAVELLRLELDFDGSMDVLEKLNILASSPMANLSQWSDAIETLEGTQLVETPAGQQVAAACRTLAEYAKGEFAMDAENARYFFLALKSINLLVFLTQDEYKRDVAEALLLNFGIKPKEL